MKTFIGKQKVNACFTATKASQQIRRMLLLSGPIQYFPLKVFLHICQVSHQSNKPSYNETSFLESQCNFWIKYSKVPEHLKIIIFILTRFMSAQSLNFSFIWCNRNFVNIVLYFTTKIVFCCCTTVNLSTTNSITINNLTNYMPPTIVEHSAHFDKMTFKKKNSYSHIL